MKAPGQRRGRMDRSMMRTYDVLPTLARQIGLRLPSGLSGRSATSDRVRRRGRVKVFSRAPLARITFSRGRLARAGGPRCGANWRCSARARAACTGSARPQLLGRPVDSLRVPPARCT